MKIKSLSYYLHKPTICNNDIRYMPLDIQLELKNLMQWCTGDIGELLYNYRRGATNYPICETCNKPLTSSSFVNGVKGYRRWCSRSCYQQSPEAKETIKLNSLAKYGTEHPLSAAEVQQKRKLTNLKKYGVGNPMHWNGVLFKNAMIAKYGEHDVRKIPQIDIKIKQSINDKNEQLYITKLEQYLISLQISPITEINIADKFQPHEFKHEPCGNVFTATLNNINQIKCNHCHRPKNLSNFQYEVEQYITHLGYNVSRNDRSLIKPYEIDILIPDKKIGIETHGDYWHTDLYVPSNLHQLKCNLARDAGVQLIQIFESEWSHQQNLIKSIIKSKLTKPDIICHARKLKIVEVDVDDEIQFFNINHLQGYAKSRICYGLVDDTGDLITCMSFNQPRFTKKYDWELIRYAVKQNHVIIGGASKLLTPFIKTHPHQTLLTYADKRISNGSLYHKLGFTLVGETTPNYWYVNIKQNKRLSRYQCQKHKLPKLLGDDFIPVLSEVENMILNGFQKIHDAGNMVFKLTM